MAINRLRTSGTEGSTKLITVSVIDDAKVAATPNELYWTASDRTGTVINSRNYIDFEVDDGSGSGGTLSAAMTIKLTGDDLAIANKTGDKLLILTVEGTYDSTAGTNLPYKNQCSFDVDNLIAIRAYVFTMEEGIFIFSASPVTFTKS